MIQVFLLALLLSAILIPAGLWVRRRVEQPNIICVRDDLDDPTQDLAFPHDFANVVASMREDREEVVVTGLFDEQT